MQFLDYIRNKFHQILGHYDRDRSKRIDLDYSELEKRVASRYGTKENPSDQIEYEDYGGYCRRCENGGWIVVGRPSGPVWIECDDCYNPNENKSP
jgi:hypothetical protein